MRSKIRPKKPRLRWSGSSGAPAGSAEEQSGATGAPVVTAELRFGMRESLAGGREAENTWKRHPGIWTLTRRAAAALSLTGRGYAAAEMRSIIAGILLRLLWPVRPAAAIPSLYSFTTSLMNFAVATRPLSTCG